MSRTRLAALLALLLAPRLATSAPPPETHLALGPLGTVRVLQPASPPRAAVVLLGAAEPQPLARALAGEGALVLVPDPPRLLAAPHGKCSYLAGRVEVLAQTVQKQLGLPAYLHPVLVGEGPGAALAYAALAQSPTGAFRGALSLGFSPELATAPLCAGGGLRRTRAAHGRGERLLPAARLPAPWRVLPQWPPSAAPPSPQLSAFVSATPGAQLLAPPAATPPAQALAAALRGLLADTAQADVAAPADERAPPAQAAPAQPPTPPTAAAGPLPPVQDLPLVLSPTQGPGPDALVLLVTGDGGWADIDRTLTRGFNARGVPVVGFDSLHYFWRKRTPEETAAAVGRALAHFGGAWQKQRLLLVGYSRGAEVLPAIAARLDPALRQRVGLLALLGAGQDAEFEVHLLDLLGGAGRDTRPILPELARIPELRVLCVYGTQEAQQSLCPRLQGRAGAQVVAVPGGHHFDKGYEPIADAVLAAAGVP